MVHHKLGASLAIVFALAATACGTSDTNQDAAPADVTEVTTFHALVEPTPSTEAPATSLVAPPATSPEAPPDAMSPLQREVVEWRTYQRQYTQQRLPDGETAEVSACVIEQAVLALPEELLPQLTNPARENLDLSTINVLGDELVQASADCGGLQGVLPQSNG